MSTCAGAWRYLIGDTIRFSNVERCEMLVTGRTKHFLSLCGEHLSVDNMTRAVKLVSDEIGLDIKEFTVFGMAYEGLYAHKWYLGIDQEEIDPGSIRLLLDEALQKLNDDYAVERKAALKEVLVEVIPTRIFYEFLKMKGKEGGQNKFPRVLNGLTREWESFVSETRKNR